MIPPRRVLAGIDFSEPSRCALTMAARLAGHCQAELHVVHAEDPLLDAAARSAGVDLAGEVRDELEAFLRASSLPPGLVVHTHVRLGPAASVLTDIASRERVDVIVVGTQGWSAGTRLIFGSTTEGVLRRARTPILAVPPAWTPPEPALSDLAGIGPVIAAIDFTAPSLDAMKAAARLARAFSAPLELLHVVPALPALARWQRHSDASIAGRIADARAELSQLAAGIRDGLPIETHVVSGPLAERIADAAAFAAGRHPLLVLGRRARGERVGAPGTTAYRVLTLSNVPVLVYLETEPD